MTHITPEFGTPLTPAVFHVLLALAGEELHGYAIMIEAERLTDGKVRLGPGTLYGTLKRLLTAGLVAEAGERADPEPAAERRRYYRLTESGERLVREEAQRLENLVAVSRTRGLLSPHRVSVL